MAMADDPVLGAVVVSEEALTARIAALGQEITRTTATTRPCSSAC